MNITSYNVTDVGYHYIGLRVLAGLTQIARRDEQTGTISRSIRKYVSDKALRLMLPEPRGTFETAGEKICQELVHLGFARSVGRSYTLTDEGKSALALLNGRRNKELRRVMVRAHLQTYDNLRLVVERHLELEGIWRPVVATERPNDRAYISRLLAPTFAEEAGYEADQLLAALNGSSAKKIEDELARLVLRRAVPEMRIGVPMFRAMSDRLLSLRVLNQVRTVRDGCEFLKTYSPCVASNPPNDWYTGLEVCLSSGERFSIFLCEPDMTTVETSERFLNAVRKAFSVLTPTAGYYDLPEVRDNVSELLKIPEAAFDEGLNHVLDLDPCPLTVGLTYEGTTGRRKPLVRDRGSVQIYNLIREV